MNLSRMWKASSRGMELVLFYGIPCVGDNAKYVANGFAPDSGKCDITSNSLSMSAINCQALFLNGAETRRSTPFECFEGAEEEC